MTSATLAPAALTPTALIPSALTPSALSPSSLSADRLEGDTVDVVPAQVRRALMEAPIGQQPLVEAALAWQRLRPSAVLPAVPGGYLPIVETDDEEVATRVARLLSSLAFATVSPTGDARWRVDVPPLRYRPVARTLALVWRQTLRRFGPDARVAGADRESAVALWRLALLLAEPEPNRSRVCFRPGGPAAGALLVSAAARLGVRAELRRLARRPAVLVDEPDQVGLLLATVLRTPAGRMLGGQVVR